MPIDPLTGASLLVMAFSAQELCQMPKPAKINVVPQTKEVKYDFSQSHKKIQSKKIDTINPYGYSSVSHTNGYMSGKISVRTSVTLDNKPLRRYNAHCVWYEDVTITIKIEPTIVIASEVAADKCMLSAVRKHELKHVNVDRQIVNKYSKSIGKVLFDGLKQRGFIAGPVKAEHLEETAKRMRETVSQLIALEYKKLDIERTERQQAVDNLKEYKRVQAKCPDFVSPVQKAAQNKLNRQ